MIVSACLVSASNFDYELSSSLFLLPCDLPSFIDVFTFFITLFNVPKFGD
jgi:hypothetical protein